ncbi:MAG: DUF4159 domain-containing protein [Bacteroidales bacterium]|nr:DUF4159 domain-containing protein [Bacteroidales bacterium]
MNLMKKVLLFIGFWSVFNGIIAQETGLQIALVKYNGGGDWYANPTSLKNLIQFCNENLKTQIKTEYATVELNDDLFNYPLIHLTGHGNILFSEKEARQLREYLLAGGFLHVSDNYGIDPFIRREMKKVFPELEFVELPYNHPIYHNFYDFKTGLPKIHEHDNKAPQGFGLIYEGRLICFYDYECDLGDGWEDADVHNDPLELRKKALMMGANIVNYVFSF